MVQEVRFEVAMTVDATKTREEIEAFIEMILNSHNQNGSSEDKATYSDLSIESIKEESDIYQNE